MLLRFIFGLIVLAAVFALSSYAYNFYSKWRYPDSVSTSVPKSKDAKERIEAEKDALAERAAVRIEQIGNESGIESNEQRGIYDRELYERRAELKKREFEAENQQRKLNEN